ncbi:MAG TPA: SGNH/GDSL hydrolase family protein [Chitinophagaceae bacterium]|nr:SGNH/GDSL hydrolase family protein [Chitinophagaceae bacterium]
MSYKYLLLVAMTFSMFGFKHQSKKKIVFFGDSITQAGVDATGYITKLKTILEKDKKSNDYELIGAGISGNKVYDLYLRMEDDVLSKKPDAVVIWIGVNDVWHKSSAGTGTDADKFEKFYDAIIKKLKQNNIAVYLCTPAAIGEKTDFSNQQDGDLNRYSNIIRNIAQKNNCPLIDLRKEFLAYNLQNNKENKEAGILTTDRVHLNEMGNAFVAEKMYAVLKGTFIK